MTAQTDLTGHSDRTAQADKAGHSDMTAHSNKTDRSDMAGRIDKIGHSDRDSVLSMKSLLEIREYLNPTIETMA